MWPKTLTVLQPVALAIIIELDKFGETLWPVAIVAVTPLTAAHHEKITHKHYVLTMFNFSLLPFLSTPLK